VGLLGHGGGPPVGPEVGWLIDEPREGPWRKQAAPGGSLMDHGGSTP
jgi:hypothetical protein